MDDAWHIKCSSTCPAPPSVPPPASFPTPPLPPPPPPPPKVSAPGSVNQMDMNSRQYFPPYIVQGSNLEDRPTIQEPLVFHTLNLDFAKSGKTELGNSFLALLSGHSHNLSSELSQLPNTRSALGKLHVHNGGIVVSGANHGVPVPSISSLSENHGVDSMWNGKISSYVESRPSLMSTSTKAPGLHNSLQIATSQCHGSGSAKPVLNQAFQGTNAGMAVSSMSCTWPIVSSPGNTSQHHTLNIQTSHKMPMEPRSSVHGHDSSLFRGRPRVFCMNTVGELFVTDMGLLSVLCFCHSLFMSVAKFCEHSGSSSVNPGEAVRLENGMTVARWHKLYFGNNALDDVKGWGCSDGPSSKSGYVGCRGSNFPTLSKNSETIDSVETFGGLGRSGEHWNKSVYANHPYTGVTQTALKNLANKDADNLYQRNRLEGHNHFFKSFTSSSQSPMPALAKNHTVQAVKESPDCMDLEASHSTLNKREQNVWPCLVPNSDNCKGNFGNPSISYLCSGTKKSFSHEYNISSGSIPSEASIVARDGRSSHIDLRLGQPSQHTHTSVSSFPTAINPLQFGAVCNSQKAQVNLPLTERTDYPRATKKPRPSLQCPPLEAPSSTRGQTQHAVGSINAFNHSETEEITGDATKNSLISLFLSHLNTEGSNSSQSTDILNNSKHFMTRVLDVDSVSAKCNLSERTSDVNDGYKRKYFLDGSDLYNNIDKEKGLRLAGNESCNIVKASYMVHNKQTEDTRILTPAIGGHCLQSNSSVDDRQSSLNFNQPSSILQNGPDSRNSNQYGKVPFLGNRDHCNHAIHSSINPVSYATARPGLLNSGTPTSLTSPKPMYISEPTSALLQKKSIDLSQQLMDENMRFLALRHMVELSKQEQSTASVETSPRRQRLCCHSTMGLERYLCKDDLVAPGDLRQGTYCDIQQNATKFAVRSVHSCSNCYSSNVVGMLAAKPGTGGPNECCNCTALTQRISQCSKEYDIQLSTCHVCGADEHPCLRLRRISNDSPDSVKHMFNQKERSPSFSGKCCCTVLSKCLTGCCFSGGDKRSESINKQSGCGKTRINQVTPAYDKDHMFRDGKNIRLGRCECSKKHDVMKNDCQIGLWRDVPTKMIKHSDATLTDKPAQMLEGSRIAGDQLPDTASKEFDGTHQVPESVNEQQMSNICSGSSAPAVTDISVEVNNVNFCATNVEDTKSAYDFLVDEGSGIEKCGSSDEALGSRECEEALSVRGKVDPIKSGYCLPGHSSGDLIDKLRLESSYNKRRVRNQIYAGCAAEENINKIQPFERVWKGEKGKEPVKMNKLDISVLKSGFYPVNSESPRFISHSTWDFSSPKGIEAPPQPDNVTQKMCIFPGSSSSVKRKRSALSSTKPLSLKENHHNMLAVSDDRSLRTLTVAAEKEAMAVHRKKQFAKQEGYHLDAEKPPKYMSLNCIGNSHNYGTETVNRKVRPVVCGKSGIISNVGLSGRQKPAKIVSLSLILKKSKRCDINEYGGKPKPSLTSETKKAPFIANNGLCNELSSWELQRNNEDSSIVRRNGTDSTIVLVSGKNKGCSSKNEEDVDEFSMIERETGGGSNRVEKLALHRENYLSQTKPRYREARRCSLSKLLGKDKYAAKPSSVLNLGESNSSNLNGAGNQPQTSPSTATGMEHHCTKLHSRKILNYALSTNLSSGKDYLNNQDHAGELCQINTRRSSKVQKCQPFLLNSDAFCCVCGSSNKEHTNYLLECNRCLIKVHQACYGVSKIPRGYWFCRPCKTNSQNTVCVLCGYEGGAMTRAVKSRNIVKCLLKAWNVGTGSSFMESIPSSETVKNEFLEPSLAGEASKYDNSGSVNTVRLTSSGAFSKAASDIASQIQTSTIRHSDNLPKNFQVYNTITAGVLDPSVTQWVHVVCGLWTPGTRCPNVDTMSAFDVSGASAARKNIVCSMCNRPGGSCIQCRVLNCSVHFHPWCAHQKGLLQSEIEGDDNEKVGFYGRCMLHATQNGFHGGSHSVDAEEGSPRKDWTCARTEGFKGRKSEEGFKPNHWKPYNDSGGCIVSQEQINAWLHINGQKSCTRAVVKQSCSDIEYDFRKEYFRYKQLKAWKHLVVYKSGIHALGLYTSQLIARGAMVVEYVGEIVGLRVADKREIEYQSGRRLQYKSACYFFRIDKEHIIDATRKGGIARFVNHSCLPNCVAKVISVRNEKKVVFFAERDINPGEEITYDYHFNSEDEGQKIPCFCNSKNCRRYLN